MTDLPSTAPAIKQTTRNRRGNFVDVVIAVIAAAVMYGFLVWIAANYDHGSQATLLLLSAVTGAAIGWIAGILVSPYNAAEQSEFSEIAKLVYGFLTGYVVSKIDPLLTKIGTEGGNGHMLVYAAYLLTSFLIAVAVTYITRSYWLSEVDRKREEAEAGSAA